MWFPPQLNDHTLAYCHKNIFDDQTYLNDDNENIFIPMQLSLWRILSPKFSNKIVNLFIQSY